MLLRCLVVAYATVGMRSRIGLCVIGFLCEEISSNSQESMRRWKALGGNKIIQMLSKICKAMSETDVKILSSDITIRYEEDNHYS